MTHCSSSRSLRKILVLLCCAFILAAWSPAPQAQRWDGKLGIQPGSLSGRQAICLGSDFKIPVVVRNMADLEIPIPVSGAAVQVTDNTGRYVAGLTERDGEVVLQWPTDQDGEFELTITAQKANYTDARQVKINIRVRGCQWLMKVDFHEEYNIIPDSTVVVGAHVKWTGVLRADRPGGEDSDSRVELLEGGGRYYFFAYDQIKAPFHFTLEQKVEGPFQINLGGYVSGNTLNLEMGSEPVSYPKVVNLRVTDYSNRGIEVKYAPPVATGGGNGLIFDMMKLTRFALPTSGGTVTYTSGGYGVFFQLPDRKEYELTIRLTPYDPKDFLSVPGYPVAAVLGR